MTSPSVRDDRDLDAAAAPLAASAPPPSGVALAAAVDAVLLLLDEEERLAREALDSTRAYAWPSWSMDTGLGAAQERYVEAWPPQRRIEACRSGRRVVRELQSWVRTHPGDDSLRLALSVVTMLRLR